MLIIKIFSLQQRIYTMKMMRLALAAAAFAAVPAAATSITVNNASFEEQPVPFSPLGCGGATNSCIFTDNGIIPGWTTGGSGGSGIFRPERPERYNVIPDGVTVAYTNSGATISQTVGVTAEAGKIYTLKAFIGDRNDLLLTAGSAKLIVGSNTVLATGIAPANGFWSEFTATYVAQLADNGSPITIMLESLNGAQGNFDHVSLTSAVPEPASWAMLIAGFGLSGAAMRRRRVTAAVA
jgi:hypothetical protein